MAKVKSKKPFDPVAFAYKAMRFQFTKRTYLPRIQAYHRAMRAFSMIECAKCLGLQPKDQTQLDHITPVIPVTGPDDSITATAHRMYCPVDQLAVLCLQCHKEKTIEENKARAVHRKIKKESNSQGAA